MSAASDASPPPRASTTEPVPTPLGQDHTRDEMITAMEKTTGSFAEHVAGPWHEPDGTDDPPAYTGPDLDPENFLKHPALTCGTELQEPEERGVEFNRTLKGPGVDDPETALEQARDWAQANGWEETNTGQGPRGRDSRFIALRAPGKPDVDFDVSHEHTMVIVTTSCSHDPSVFAHREERSNDPRYEYRVPDDPYASSSPPGP